MALSTEDAARLASLKAGYDKLLLGSNVVRVQTHGGRMVEMGPGDITALKREIDQLEAAAVARVPRSRGALRFVVH